MLGKLSFKSSKRCPQGQCVQVAITPDGRILVRDSKHPDREPLTFTVGEWVGFVLGVKDGEFDVPTQRRQQDDVR